MAKPQICGHASLVFNSAGNYEKSLCYVKQKTAYFNAREICQKLGMRLYQVQSSVAAASAISYFAKSMLGGSKKAFVYVDGFSGKKCMRYSGDGTSSYDWCKTSYNFLCEFKDKGEITFRLFNIIFSIFFPFKLLQKLKFVKKSSI
jgi:hypothetical protein